MVRLISVALGAAAILGLMFFAWNYAYSQGVKAGRNAAIAEQAVAIAEAQNAASERIADAERRLAEAEERNLREREESATIFAEMIERARQENAELDVCLGLPPIPLGLRPQTPGSRAGGDAI